MTAQDALRAACVMVSHCLHYDAMVVLAIRYLIILHWQPVA